MVIAPPRSSTPSASRSAARDVALALPAVAASGGATWWLLGLPASYALLVIVLYAVTATVLITKAPADLPPPGLGTANRVTLGRATLAVPIGAVALRLPALDSIGYWWVIGLSIAVMVLDGVDGRIARSSDTESAYGARFDMELDTAFILALSLLVWASGKAGPWVLLIGAMRYVFVAAGWIWPILRGQLPPSLRRKAVCVAQGVVLLVALGPIVPAGMASVVTGAGLAALTYSFGADIVWLARAGRS
jgi:phosphatidylglycerophosphate synthase